MADKLFVVVRADLSTAQQAVQAVHAALAFQREHREVCAGLDNLALLAVPDELALANLLFRICDTGVPVEVFREEDLGHQMTAAAFGPGGRKLVSSLPKALKPAPSNGAAPSASPTPQAAAPGAAA